jgi:pimeloyl-ACP methyl ester carboxylesterase
MEEHTIAVGDGAIPDRRAVAFTDAGPPDGTALLWCHGGPGSRLEPAAMAPNAADAGLRAVGIDRPGYGRSTPQPGRTIAGWVPEALAVVDTLGIERFLVVGVSTGGAYALALAAIVPERVLGVVACCALTDMRWPEGKAMMSDPETAGIWSAPDRDAALAIATEGFGVDGSKMMERASSSDVVLPAADIATLIDPQFLAGMAQGMREMFAFGVQGYTDDRIADGSGWHTFDVAKIRCPVTVLHGRADPVVPVDHASHTAEIVPGATLRVLDDLGHFSIIEHVVPTALDLVAH